MLIRKAILDRIKSGEVTLAFRRWNRPTVRTGGTLTTSVGVLTIHGIERVSASEISESDAAAAGYSSKAALARQLRQREGHVYRIALGYEGMDPRIALREDDRLSPDELDEIVKRLEGLDSRSTHGAWTRSAMTRIRENPMKPAAELADEMRLPKDWLKASIRKLKNLGLTQSHHPGYTLSPRGVAVLRHLGQNT